MPDQCDQCYGESGVDQKVGLAGDHTVCEKDVGSTNSWIILVLNFYLMRLSTWSQVTRMTVVCNKCNMYI